MALLDENTKKQVKEFLASMDGDVSLSLNIRKDDCEHCSDVKELLEEISALTDNVKLVVNEVGGDEKAPTITIKGKNKGSMTYYGIPAGHEFGAFLTAIKEASKGDSDIIDGETKKGIQTIKEGVNIKVFVTPACGYCPAAAVTAYAFALLNGNVTTEVYESMEFPNEANKYRVRAVPKVVINDKVEFEGAIPPDMFLKKVESALE
ncbi:MAG: glutaredoxin [Methanobacteriota archaeon]|nr:MAG: glutaredoxin [Euryarchaeota archaeon]